MDIGEINNVSGPYEANNSNKIRKQDKASSVKLNKDNIEISEYAKSAYKDQKLVNLVRDLPDIRTEIVEEAKLKISSGEIFSNQIISETADKIIKGLS